MRLNRELNCSFLLAVRSELLEEAPQIFGFLLVLNPRKHHFGARNLRLGIFDVFLESRFVPDDPGIFVRIRVIEAWHRARLAPFRPLRIGPTMFLAVSPNLLWQVIHFLNDVSPAAISPATATPAEDRERDNRYRNRLHYFAWSLSLTHSLSFTLRLSRKLIRSKPSTLCARGPCVSKCREPTKPKRDVKGPRTILLVAAAQNNFNAFSDEIQDFRRLS